jgi:trigger factor
MADEPEGTAAATAEQPARLTQSVEIKDVGPCRKYVKVTVEREAIDARFDEKYTEIVRDSSSPIDGFRPGKAPRKVIERRFGKEVGEQVKAEVLMASLEQLATENSLLPLAPPDINPNKIEFPKDGPLVYEFEVEVAPQFDLPDYKGLKLKRPVKQFGDADIQKEEKRLFEQSGQVVPKDGPVAEGDIITAGFTVTDGSRELSKIPEVQIKVEPRLAFNDGVIEKFAAVIAGAKVGDSRTADLTLSSAVPDESLRGKSVKAEFTIKDVKTVRLPEVTDELLGQFGVKTIDQFRELIRVALERRLEYAQRQSARAQVLGLIAEASQWELPQDLLQRQSRKALARRVMEMRSAGMSEEEIHGRLRILQQDVLQSTAAALKEHFVLQKVAEVEKLEITEDDINDEIERIADRADESPRRVRARLEKEDLLDTVATDLLERKALDLILSSAEYEDVPLDAASQDAPVAAVEATAAGEAPEQTAPPAGS